MSASKPLPTSETQGFSLVELIVALGVMSFLMVGMLRIFSSSMSTLASTSETLSIQRSARWGTSLMMEDIIQSGYLFPPRFVPELFTYSDQPPLKIETLDTPIDITDSLGAAEQLTVDELQVVEDVPLSVEGTLSAVASKDDNTLTASIPSGGDTIKIGDVAFLKDSAWESFSIKAISGVGSTYTITIADTGSLVDEFGNDKGTVNSPSVGFPHKIGAQLTFIRPLQVLSYTILPLALDPSNTANREPCLVRRVKNLGAGAWGTPEIIVEGATGFNLDWSLDGGKSWVRAKNGYTTAQWDKIALVTDAELKAVDNRFTKQLPGGLSDSKDRLWYKYVPIVIRMDLETRTRLKRAEYGTGTANNPVAAYRTRRQTLFVSPRNFVLGTP